jgi:hypothetical protein
MLGLTDYTCRILSMLRSCTSLKNGKNQSKWPCFFVGLNLSVTSENQNVLFMTIKNRILSMMFIATLVAFVASEVNAQSMLTRPRAGIKGGLNASNLYVDNVNDENARLGFNVGLFGELISTEAFGLQAELLYTTKGSKNVYDDPFDQEIKYNLNYLELPLFAVFKIGAVDLHVGGYGSYLLDANVRYDGDLADGTDEIDKDNLKSWDYGLLAGVGVNFGAMQIGARYNYGLAKIADSNGARKLLGDSKNSCAQLFVAFNLNAEPKE